MKQTIGLKALPAVLAATVLTACGGGGGGGGGNGDSSTATPARTNITEAQAFSVAQTIDSDVSDLFDGAVYGLDYVDQASVMVRSVVGSKTAQRPIQGNTTLMVMKYVNENRLASAFAGSTESLACNNGGALQAVSNQKNPDTYSAGDTLSVTSQDCVINGVRLVGGFNLKVTSVRGDLYSTTGSYGLTIAATYNNFGAFDAQNNSASINGSVTMIFDENLDTGVYSVAAQGSALSGSASKQGGAAETVNIRNYRIALNGDNNKESVTYQGDIFGSTSTLGSYSYKIATPTAFTVLNVNMYPSSGQAVITGANATVTITAVNTTTVRIDYTDASGTKTQLKSWSDFDA